MLFFAAFFLFNHFSYFFSKECWNSLLDRERAHYHPASQPADTPHKSPTFIRNISNVVDDDDARNDENKIRERNVACISKNTYNTYVNFGYRRGRVQFKYPQREREREAAEFASEANKINENILIKPTYETQLIYDLVWS